MADDLPHYRSFVLSDRCPCQPCVTPPQFHHAQHGETFVPWARPPKALPGRRGKSQRASDWYGIAMCWSHHSELHDIKGFFRGYTKEKARIWMDERIADTQQRYADQYPDKLNQRPERSERRSKLAVRHSKRGGGWTVPLVIDLLKKQARVSRGEIAVVLEDLALLIERGKVH